MSRGRFFSGPEMQRVLLEALILCILAAAIGLSLNFEMVFNAFSGKAAALSAAGTDTSREAREVQVDAFPMPVTLEELDGFLAEGAVLVDARNSKAFAEGHLENSVSLPLGQFDQEIENFKNRFARNRTLIIYCSGYGCPDSFDLGVRLLKEGYGDVLVYEGGFPEWRDSGRPVVKGAES